MSVIYPWEWHMYRVSWTRVRICCPGAIPFTGSGNWTGKWLKPIAYGRATVDLFMSQDNTQCPLFCLSERSQCTSGNRCTGAWMDSHSPLHVLTNTINIPNTLQSEGGGTEIDINSSEVVREILASRDRTYAVQRPVVSPAAQRSFVTSRGGDFSSSSRLPGTMGLACELVQFKYNQSVWQHY